MTGRGGRKATWPPPDQDKSITKDPNARYRVLGYQLPLNAATELGFRKQNEFFPFEKYPSANPIRWHGTPATLRERDTIAVLDKLTDKPDWERKVYDDGILGKWREECKQMGEFMRIAGRGEGFSDAMFDYCAAELRDYASISKTHGFVPAIDATATVYKSDVIIPEAVKDALRLAAKPLEDVSDPDWHPGSNGTVLDLVHPSLFPLLYGRSRILLHETVPLKRCVEYTGRGEIIPQPSEDDIEFAEYDRPPRSPGQPMHPEAAYSARFQWLPCEVAFRGTDGAEIVSYINNLHPGKHSALYDVLGQVISKVVPMWNKCLKATSSTRAIERIDGAKASYTEPKPPSEEVDRLVDQQTGPRERGMPMPVRRRHAEDEWVQANRVLIQPEPNKYDHRPFRRGGGTIDLREGFRSQGLQVIVKLANIHLTPGKTAYDGGSWHIEGSLNEHICASALYYYDSENITDSHLSFREAMDIEGVDRKHYDQDDWGHLEKLYGHRVEPFRLADPSRPGHRKIVALFLVDPYVRIPSTINVPPQRKDWWQESALAAESRFGELPPELIENVVRNVEDFPIDLEEAKQLRLELMEERKVFVAAADAKLREDTFSFCEH
ncbi:hypothetical protein KC318_g8352 [Hortaea werneckii]|uniref:Uncharacterized protein n=1 Tax=Hortaea werneckii TaxID=91943 RepID=A0A3M7ADE1_HORWE|nr:hypothetical protein KC334_g8608 [Hortaea werneckii]KAI7004555.1 hypothetical protein KC355_g8662 [Hortaea werneckii]KAI7663358.1 hypothetical protein KC318_g8352 [Hortaea werneckii]RMY25545.1 hypothetical protein D0867_00675 [Hortaea werneckii]